MCQEGGDDEFPLPRTYVLCYGSHPSALVSSDTMAMAFFFQLLPDHPGVLIAAAQVNDGFLVTQPRTSIRLVQLYVVAIFFSSIIVC